MPDGRIRRAHSVAQKCRRIISCPPAQAGARGGRCMAKRMKGGTRGIRIHRLPFWHDYALRSQSSTT
eukprot:4389920-Pyramimonas_sp.AAC.1